MLSPNEAYQIIQGNVPTLPSEKVNFDSAVSRVLRAPVLADRPLPPFDRVMMDGVALSLKAASQGQTTFKIEGTQTAGAPSVSLQNNQACLEVMTGSVLPEGCDCVVPYEEVTIKDGQATLNENVSTDEWQFVHRKGSDFEQGTELLPAGVPLSSRELAVAASCGAHLLTVSKQPKITVISTGDELVDVQETPLPYQIRRSNSHSILAALDAMRIRGAKMAHLSDDKKTIEAGLKTHLEQSDVLILSGGISKGKKDFLPEALESLGVEKLFQWVKQRPGKPFWFGKQKGTEKIVFALPGNPLSTLVCFHRYVKPALERMMARREDKEVWVRLAKEFHFPKPLNYFLPVKLTPSKEGTLEATPCAANNSGDYASVVSTDGFVELPDLLNDFPVGFTARFFPWT